MKRRKFKNFDLEKVVVADAATDGRGVVRSEGRKIFVPFTVPGDEVDIHVCDMKKRLFSANLLQVHTQSENRIAPKCKHFGVCGGCKWQMMNYKTQLFFKNKQVNDIFDRIAKVEVKERRPILGVQHDFFYRNKLEFSFSNKLWIPR
ncbi:MAG: 23S rRNA (uracil-5-)-methyltransferase RumA, partial [Bacteroidia bacterium]